VDTSIVYLLPGKIMISIVVPAHNESSGIARTLSAITLGCKREELDVLVVCNGCTDDTADIARRFGPPVRVIETEVANKCHALNLGDRFARAFPRIYIDADIVITIQGVRTLAKRLAQGDVLAVAPSAQIDTSQSSLAVRAYYGIRARLPSSRQGIGGSGVYALSKMGHDRFVEFPNLVADDMFVRIQLSPQERQTLTSVSSTVFAPRTLRQLIAIRTRAHYGTLEIANRHPELFRNNRGESNHRVLGRQLLNPRSWPGLLVYTYVNSVAIWSAKRWRRAGSFVWKRDSTSRVALEGSSN